MRGRWDASHTHTFSHCVDVHTHISVHSMQQVTPCSSTSLLSLHCLGFFCLVSKSCITQCNTIVRLATCKEMFLSAVCAVSKSRTEEDRWKGKERNVIFGLCLSLRFRRNIWACLFCRAPDVAEYLMGFQPFLGCKPEYDGSRCFCSK